MSNIEEHIRKAYEQGQFDNLPGKGKPLNLDDNPYEDPEWRLAYKMLKDGGFSLPWIEARSEIENSIEQANSELQRAWNYRQHQLEGGQSTPQVQDAWLRALESYQQRIARINKNILDYNLSAPSAHFHLIAVNTAGEIERITKG